MGNIKLTTIVERSQVQFLSSCIFKCNVKFVKCLEFTQADCPIVSQNVYICMMNSDTFLYKRIYLNPVSIAIALVTTIQGVLRLVDITAGGDFLGLCDQKISYKYVSDFGRLRSYEHFLIPVHALV